MKFRKWIIALITIASVSSVFGQPRLVNRDSERKEFPDLHETEAYQEKNIQETYTELQRMGFLVRMTQLDRQTAFEEQQPENQYDFTKTSRLVEYTPRNTYIRFVANNQQFLLNTFGAAEKIKAQMDERVAKAKEIKAWSTEQGYKDINFGGDKNGVELTQFAFIYSDDEAHRKVVGSRRKSVSLFFNDATGEVAQGQVLTLNMVVTRLERDDFKEGVRNVYLIVDPSPETQAMDDIVILHRYNQKPTQVTVLGMMSNTATNPHRNHFKQKFYVKLLKHFFRLYRMVANYASKGDNDYNNEVLESIEYTLEY
ncbi:MAG: hypothetical protein RIF32_19500 [Leptospirales bacterium]|jgi:hypothetical protein